jgi:hypothetical protein
MFKSLTDREGALTKSKVRDFGIAADYKEVGYYVGYIASSFSFAQMCTGTLGIYKLLTMLTRHRRHDMGMALGSTGKKASFIDWATWKYTNEPLIWLESLSCMGHCIKTGLWPFEWCVTHPKYRHMTQT